MLQKGAAWRQSQEEPALAAGGGERANIFIRNQPVNLNLLNRKRMRDRNKKYKLI